MNDTYANVGWTVADLQTLFDVSDKAAEKFFAEYERRIQDRLVELGWEVLGTLGDVAGLKRVNDDDYAFNPTNAQINFFEKEIKHHETAGLSPATLRSAYNSLLKADATEIVEWCNDDTVRDESLVEEFIASIEEAMIELDESIRLQELLPGPEDEHA